MGGGGPLYPSTHESPYRKSLSKRIFSSRVHSHSGRAHSQRPTSSHGTIQRSLPALPSQQDGLSSISNNVWNRTTTSSLRKRLADRRGLCHLFVGYGGDSMMELLTEVIVAGTFVYGLGFVFR